jgi:NADH dehydrogenase [ubiquinone] 1 alpha subcomplex assembly factor 6
MNFCRSINDQTTSHAFHEGEHTAEAYSPKPLCLEMHLCDDCPRTIQYPRPLPISNHRSRHKCSTKLLLEPRPVSIPPTPPSLISPANPSRKFDNPSYVLQTFIPPSTRDVYLSIRALNIELARIPDLISSPTVGALRMQFWRDNITRAFASTPPAEPVAILLHHALTRLRAGYPHASTTTLKAWFMKIITARETYMDNRPYTDLSALETYAENTYSTLLYLTLGFLPLHSLAVDHLASHIGKATGIAAVLRGLPLIAFPPPPNHHSNSGTLGLGLGGASGGRHGAVVLPLSVMVDAGVKEEEVLRQGAAAPGLRDAVFAVATRANDHLITAEAMLRNLQKGEAAGHDFEHEGEEGHEYAAVAVGGEMGAVEKEVERGFGVLMPAVSTKLWLQRLEKADFDVFDEGLRGRSWKLPWKAYFAYRGKNF